MNKTIRAHFDGQVIVPDEPIQLPLGQSFEIEVRIPDEEPPRHAALLQFARDFPDLPTDLAAQHDHYLYGTPKK